MSELSRARKLLNDLVATRVLTPAGLAWLTLAVDPWHDTDVTNLEGLPDQGIGKSVSFQVVQEISISKNTSPVALPAGNWSVRIGTLPILSRCIMGKGRFYGDIISQDNAPGALDRGQIDSVNIQYAPDGTDFDDTAPVLAPGSVGISLPSEYTKGVMKILGIGVEVINTTASLYKQGLVSYCRMVQPETEPFTSYVALTTPPNNWATKTMTPMRTLPKNLKEMALYPGFAQTEAAEGYYAPILLKFARQRHYPIPATVLLLDDDPSGGTLSPANSIACHSSLLNPQVIPGNTTPFNTSNDLPLFYDGDSNCCVFSGLSDQTTLTLRVRFICERFPSDAEGQMLVIATPSAVYDPVALELYSRAVQKLPAGVPFSENPAGEWWGKMIATIVDAAQPFLGAIHPALGLAAKGVSTLVTAGTERARDSRKKKQAKATAGKTQTIVPRGVTNMPASPSTRPPSRAPKPLPAIPKGRKA